MSINLYDSKILITGAAGSTGSQLLFEFNKRGIKPIAHVRMFSDTSYIDSLGLEKRVADLRRKDQMMELMDGIDYVIHTAARVNLRQDRLTQFAGINTIAPLDLFQAAHRAGVKRFLHISSIAAVGAIKRSEIIGDIEDHLINEETEYNFDQFRIPYFMTKRAAETELQKTAADSKTELVIVNPSIIISPSKTVDGRTRGLKIFGRLAFPDLPVRINVVDIRDLAPGIISALEYGKNGERYILGGDNITLRDIALDASAILGRIPHLIHVPHKLFYVAANLSYFFSRMLGRSEIRFYPDIVKLFEYDWAFSSKKAHDAFGYNWRSVHITMEDIFTNNMVGTYLKPEP